MAQGLTTIETLWVEYYYLTELYDRHLPHTISERGGEAIVHPPFRRLSMRYSSELRSIMRNRFYVSSHEVTDYSRYSFEDITSLYELLVDYSLTNEMHNKPQPVFRGDWKTIWQGSKE